MSEQAYRDPRIEAEIEQQWREFWLPIVAPSGIVDIDQVKRELYDFRMVMDRVSVVYDDLTCGRISKITTDAEHVISQARECFDRDFTEDLIEDLDTRMEEIRAKRSTYPDGSQNRIAAAGYLEALKDMRAELAKRLE